jgi:hypothetical protein
MCWSVVLRCLIDNAEDDAELTKKRDNIAAVKAVGERLKSQQPENGGVLAADLSAKTTQDIKTLREESLQKHIKEASKWLGKVFSDAVAYAAANPPRGMDTLDKLLVRPRVPSNSLKASNVEAMFRESALPPLKTRGWKETAIAEGDSAGKTVYSYNGKEVRLFRSFVALVRIFISLRSVLIFCAVQDP